MLVPYLCQRIIICLWGHCWCNNFQARSDNKQSFLQEEVLPFFLKRAFCSLFLRGFRGQINVPVFWIQWPRPLTPSKDRVVLWMAQFYDQRSSHPIWFNPTFFFVDLIWGNALNHQHQDCDGLLEEPKPRRLRIDEGCLLDHQQEK
jgi:hypothetical protein